MMVIAVEAKVQETGMRGGGVVTSVGWLGKALLARRQAELRKQALRTSGGRACQVKGILSTNVLR